MTDQQVQPEGVAGPPVGTGMPHSEDPSTEFPDSLWELHTLESWARAFLASLLDLNSRPPVPPPGQAPNAPFLPQGREQVNFYVVALKDNRLGVAATVRHRAPTGEWAYVHHLLKLDLEGNFPSTTAT